METGEELEGKISSSTEATEGEKPLEEPTQDANVEVELEFKCDVCPKSFAGERSLRSHIKIHNAKQLECPVCEGSFNRTDALFNHLVEHSVVSVKYFPCLIADCEMIMESHETATQHFEEFHNMSDSSHLKCKTCDETLIGFRRLFSHNELKHGTWAEFYLEAIEKQKLIVRERKRCSREKKKRIHDAKIQDQTPNIETEDRDGDHTYHRKLSKLEEEAADCPSATPATVAETETSEPDRITSPGHVESEEASDKSDEGITTVHPSEMLEHLSGFVAKLFPLAEDERFYTCNHCLLGFGDAILWMTHLAYHTDGDPFKCSSCRRTYQNRHSFVIHLTYFSHEPDENNNVSV